MKIATISIGSKKIAASVFEIKNEGFRKIFAKSVDTFLSRDMGIENRLQEENIAKAIKALSEFSNAIERFGDVKINAVCTEAVRRAINQEDFLERVKAVLGKKSSIEIVNGKQEAYYCYLGVINTTSLSDFVLIDVGGASTEVVLVKDRKLESSVSIPIGGIELTDKFFPHDIAMPYNISEAEHFMLEKFAKIDWLKDLKNLPIVAVASSMRNLAAAEMRKKLATSSALHNYMINSSNFRFMYRQIGKLSVEERHDKLEISKGTSEVICGGLAPISALFKQINARRVYFSDFGVMQGVFFEKRAEYLNYPTPVEGDVLGASINRILEKYEADLAHSKKVEEISLKIFDETKEIHGLHDKYRSLLSIAARMHDIGEFVQYNNHHQHSYYLIKENDIYGLDQWDKLFCAIIAGEHNKDKLKLDRKFNLKTLSADKLKKFRDLGTIIGIAENIGIADFVLSSTSTTIDIKAKGNAGLSVDFGRQLFSRNVLLS